MTAQDRIDKLKQEIATAREEQKNCKHAWKEPVYDPEMVKKEILTGEYEVNGIHRHPLTALIDEQKPRWSRTCKTCGIKEYTYKQGAKVVTTGPEFK